VTHEERLIRRKPVVSDFVYPCVGSCGAWVNQLSHPTKKGKKALICSVCNSCGITMPTMADFKSPAVLIVIS